MEVRIKKIILVVMLLRISYSIFHIPQALASIGISPANLEFDLTHGPATQTLFLQNLSPQGQQITLRLENHQYDPYVKIDPAAFSLTADETKTVNITAQPAKNFQTNLEIIAKDGTLSGNFQIASGIKIPLAAYSETLANYKSFFPSILAVIITVLFYWQTKRNRPIQKNH